MPVANRNLTEVPTRLPSEMRADFKAVCEEKICSEGLLDGVRDNHKWLVGTALYALLLERVLTHSNEETVNSRYMAHKIRQTEFPELFELLEVENAVRHTYNGGNASTQVFQRLRDHGFLCHYSTYEWEYTESFEALRKEVTAEAMERYRQREGAGEIPPVALEGASILEGLSIRYFYNGNTISKEVYEDLMDSGITSLCERIIVDALDDRIDPVEVVAQLIEANT